MSGDQSSLDDYFIQVRESLATGNDGDKSWDDFTNHERSYMALRYKFVSLFGMIIMYAWPKFYVDEIERLLVMLSHAHEEGRGFINRQLRHVVSFLYQMSGHGLRGDVELFIIPALVQGKEIPIDNLAKWEMLVHETRETIDDFFEHAIFISNGPLLHMDPSKTLLDLAEVFIMSKVHQTPALARSNAAENGNFPPFMRGISLVPPNLQAIESTDTSDTAAALPTTTTTDAAVDTAATAATTTTTTTTNNNVSLSNTTAATTAPVGMGRAVTGIFRRVLSSSPNHSPTRRQATLRSIPSEIGGPEFQGEVRIALESIQEAVASIQSTQSQCQAASAQARMALTQFQEPLTRIAFNVHRLGQLANANQQHQAHVENQAAGDGTNQQDSGNSGSTGRRNNNGTRRRWFGRRRR